MVDIKKVVFLHSKQTTMKTAITHFTGSEETANEIANEYNELLNTNSFRVEKTNEENVFRIIGLVSEEDLSNFNIEDEFVIN